MARHLALKRLGDESPLAPTAPERFTLRELAGDDVYEPNLNSEVAGSGPRSSTGIVDEQVGHLFDLEGHARSGCSTRRS
ncbi:MAG TPA: hypothetical protein VFT22_10220 [Kofleriaceae bacterium]|nr:hypothetical protein [Kofleriaceae bacterium]